MRAVSQDVSDRKDGLFPPSKFVGFEGPVHLNTISEGSCQRLLAHDVQSAQVGQSHNHFAMHVIQHADEDSVNTRRSVLVTGIGPGPTTSLIGDEVTPISESGTFGWWGLRAPYHSLAKAVPLVFIRLCDSSNHAAG